MEVPWSRIGTKDLVLDGPSPAPVSASRALPPFAGTGAPRVRSGLAIRTRRGCDVAETKHAEVTWDGDLMSGAGTIERVGSGAIASLPVSWAARTGEGEKELTSPEELIAAAHAACFSMALSSALAKAGTPPTRLRVSAEVTFVPGTGITTSALDVEGEVPGIDEAAFREAAENARDNCPVSGALKGNVEMTVDARLANG